MSRADAGANVAPCLVAEGLVAGYYSDIHILQGISVQAVPGEVRVILGPNGTGKSTLLKTIFGFLTPTEGRITFQGHDIRDLGPHKMLAAGITYLPQRPSLFPFLTVEANLRLGLWTERRHRTTVQSAVEQAYAHFPVLKERRRVLAGTLSGGQQRQLEMARSLMANPLLLLIDEPTAGVEPRVTGQIYRIVRALAKEQGKAVLLVDQDIKSALDIADYVYIVQTGRIRTEGRRAAFGGDIEDLVAKWLYTTG